MATVSDLVRFLEELAPPQFAASWDNIGLLLGSPAAEVTRVMACLTITPESAAEAVAAGAQLIVTHHPIFFRPVQRLTTATPEGRMVLDLVRAGVAVYSAHTAFDNAPAGINDLLAQRLGLTAVSPLRPRENPGQCKLVVFVPEGDLDRVSAALFAHGAGIIGRYRECSFRTPGTGTFFGSENTNPTVGQRGRREEASELRLEVVCPAERVGAAIAALREVHSYEEPAFDVYPLRPQGATGGDGRIGDLPAIVPLRDLAQTVRHNLPAPVTQVVGDPDRGVRRVAIACGAAGEFLADAVREQADVFLTGEVRFHDCLAARAQDIALILPGHYATERPGVENLAEQFKARFPSLEVWAGRREQDPLWTVE